MKNSFLAKSNNLDWKTSGEAMRLINNCSSIKSNQIDIEPDGSFIYRCSHCPKIYDCQKKLNLHIVDNHTKKRITKHPLYKQFIKQKRKNKSLKDFYKELGIEYKF
jgi:hypothetical protein